MDPRRAAAKLFLAGHLFAGRWSRRSIAMALHVVDGLELAVDRGPNWLFVKLRTKSVKRKNVRHLADKLWSIASRHFIYRLVVELDELDELPAACTEELVNLQGRLVECGGALRICGLSPECEETLQSCHADTTLTNHASRAAAVLGSGEYAVLPR
jgi:anti-anti-sigma regulatory factor